MTTSAQHPWEPAPRDAPTWEIGGKNNNLKNICNKKIAEGLLSHCWLVFIGTGKPRFGMLIIYFVNHKDCGGELLAFQFPAVAGLGLVK